MKLMTKVSCCALVAGLMGYGAYALYDKVLKYKMKDMEDMFKKVSNDVEKSLDEMK